MLWRSILPVRGVSRLLIFLLSFSAIVVLQWRANAFRSELGANPDEPAHYVTGLLVHDYLASGMPRAPLPYARDYYLHYPKVALGHWPPLFYLAQAAWTLVFTPGRFSVMLLMAAITAALATVFCEAMVKDFSLGAGIGATAFLLTLPIVEEYSHLLMSEMLLTLLVLLAVLAYGRYLDTERWQPAAWFGVWVTLAMLTKGTGIELALVPPLCVFFGRRWALLRRFSFWLPAILVISIAGPWYWWVPGAQHESVARFGGVMMRNPRFLDTPAAWVRMLGVVPMVAAVAGLFSLRQKSLRGSPKGKWLAAAAVLAGAYLFRMVIMAWDVRHLVTTIPLLLMFATAGVAWLLAQASRTSVIARQQWLVGLALAALVLLNIQQSPAKLHHGFAEVAQDLLANPQYRQAAFLVCSNAEGEGMLISEVAMHETRPGHIVLRASKMLATITWMGTNYQSRFHSPAEVSQYLEGIPVRIVVIDGGALDHEHGRLLSRILHEHPETWELLAQYHGDKPPTPKDSGILVYRLIGHENQPMSKIQIPMQRSGYWPPGE
jgi:hypothetical protein